MREKLTNTAWVIAIKFVIISKAKQLCHISFWLPFDHFEKMGQGYQVLVARELLFVFQFEQDLMLSSLVDGEKYLNNNWYEYK